MSTKLILKKSSVASNPPDPVDLEVGELAVNLADAKLYSKNVGGTVIELGENPVTLGSLDQSFTTSETATITLSEAIAVPTVSATKEVPREGLTNDDFDVSVGGTNFDIDDLAPSGDDLIFEARFASTTNSKLICFLYFPLFSHIQNWVIV